MGTVPNRGWAVQQGAKGKFVFVVGADSKAEARPVEVGDWLGQDWVIDFNYSAGDRVQLLPGQSYVASNFSGQVLITLSSGDTIGLAGVDFNLFNSSAVLTVNNSYAVWQVPTGILNARLFKISGQFTF